MKAKGNGPNRIGHSAMKRLRDERKRPPTLTVKRRSLVYVQGPAAVLRLIHQHGDRSDVEFVIVGAPR